MIFRDLGFKNTCIPTAEDIFICIEMEMTLQGLLLKIACLPTFIFDSVFLKYLLVGRENKFFSKLPKI